MTKKNTQITYKAGDQPNNAFSLNVLHPGEIAATAGTSAVIYAVTDKNIYDKNERINTININCAVVLDFAIVLVIKVRLFLFIFILSSVINTSLKIIKPTIQNSIKSIMAKEIKAERAKILSARGSKNLPYSVTASYFLA